MKIFEHCLEDDACHLYSLEKLNRTEAIDIFTTGNIYGVL